MDVRLWTSHRENRTPRGTRRAGAAGTKNLTHRKRIRTAGRDRAEIDRSNVGSIGSDRWKHLLRGWWFSIISPPIVSADRQACESVCVSAEWSCAGMCVCVGLGSAFPPFKKTERLSLWLSVAVVATKRRHQGSRRRSEIRSSKIWDSVAGSVNPEQSVPGHGLNPSLCLPLIFY